MPYFRFKPLILVLVLLLAACGGTGTPESAPQQPAPEGGVADPTHSVFVPGVSSEGEPPQGGVPDQTAPGEGGHSVYAPAIQSGNIPAGSGELPAPPAEPQLDPHVVVEASQVNLRVGETITVRGTPVQIGLPYYLLTLNDEGVQDAAALVQVTFENAITPMEGVSQVLELVSSEGFLDHVIFFLRARAPGVTTLTITATGEVPVGEAGEAIWSGGSGSVVITVTE